MAMVQGFYSSAVLHLVSTIFDALIITSTEVLSLCSNYDLSLCVTSLLCYCSMSSCLSLQICLMRRRIGCSPFKPASCRSYSCSELSEGVPLDVGCWSVCFLAAWATFLSLVVSLRDCPCISQLAPCWPCSVLGRLSSALRSVLRFLCNTKVSLLASVWRLTMEQRYTLPILSLAYLGRVS